MIAIDLVTGFLGAGKTTFICQYVSYLKSQGKRVAILENDFGAVNIDMILLQDLEDEMCELEMVAGGCDKDCHIRRFKTKLISLGMRGFDRIIVEPSGIFDVDEFYDVLAEEPLDRWYEIGNVFAIVDANLEQNLSKASEYLLASQIANAGSVLLSKVQLASSKQIQETKAYLQTCLNKVHCKRIIEDAVIALDWNMLTEETYQKLLQCGYKGADYEKLWFDEKEAFQSVYLWHVKNTIEEMKADTEKILSDVSCGHVMRVKGFLLREDGTYEMFNATQKEMKIECVQKAQEVVIVIGEALDEERIRSVYGAYDEP